jgi:hypothetical protein
MAPSASRTILPQGLGAALGKIHQTAVEPRKSDSSIHPIIVSKIDLYISSAFPFRLAPVDDTLHIVSVYFDQ